MVILCFSGRRNMKSGYHITRVGIEEYYSQWSGGQAQSELVAFNPLQEVFWGRKYTPKYEDEVAEDLQNIWSP